MALLPSFWPRPPWTSPTILYVAAGPAKGVLVRVHPISACVALCRVVLGTPLKCGLFPHNVCCCRSVRTVPGGFCRPASWCLPLLDLPLECFSLYERFVVSPGFTSLWASPPWTPTCLPCVSPCSLWSSCCHRPGFFLTCLDLWAPNVREVCFFAPLSPGWGASWSPVVFLGPFCVFGDLKLWGKLLCSDTNP